MIRYARACSTYEHFIYRGKLLTDKLLKQEYRKSRLKSTFRKCYGRYNDLVCDYSVSLNEMLRYLFDGGCWSVCTNCDEELFLTFFTDNVLWTRGGCDRSAGDAYSSMAPDPTSWFQRSVLSNAHWICICVLDVSDDFNFGIFDSCIYKYFNVQHTHVNIILKLKKC